MNCRDVLGVLPTGFGKSLFFFSSFLWSFFFLIPVGLLLLCKQPIKKIVKSVIPKSGAHRLTKKPKDPGYEIETTADAW